MSGLGASIGAHGVTVGLGAYLAAAESPDFVAASPLLETTLGSGTVTPDLGATPQAGDILIAQLCTTDGVVAATMPSGQGWELLLPEQHGTQMLHQLYWKRWGVADQTDDASPSITLNAVQTLRIVLSLWRGCAASDDPFDASGAVDVQGIDTGTTMTAPDATSAGAGRTAVRFYASNDDHAHGSQSEGALAYGGAAYDGTLGTDGALSCAYFRGKVAGAVGAATMSFTAGTAGARWVAATVVLRPGAGSPPIITAQPSSVDIPIGLTQTNAATFTVTATGATGYQWEYDDGGGYVDVDGGESDFTATDFDGPAIDLDDVALAASGYTFRCKVLNAFGTSTSDPATLTTHRATAAEIAAALGINVVNEVTPSGIDSSVGDGNAFETWAAAVGDDWSEPIAANRPLYSATGGATGGPAVRFAYNGLNRRHLSVGPNLSALTAGESFVRLNVEDHNWAGLNTGGIYELGNDNALNQFTHYEFDDGNIYDTFGTTVRKVFSSSGPIDGLGWHVYNPSSASGAWSARRNSTVLHSTGTNTVFFPAAPRLGHANVAAAQIQFVGWMDYFVLFDAALSADGRTDMLAFLGF